MRTKIKKPVGRPRKYDLIEEAKDLLEWSKLDNALTLYDFTDDKDYLASELSGFAKAEPEFAKALKKAKERIGNRREQHANDDMINYGVWARSASLYSTILDDWEEDKKDRDLQRKKELFDYELMRKNQTETSEMNLVKLVQLIQAGLLSQTNLPTQE